MNDSQQYSGVATPESEVSRAIDIIAAHGKQLKVRHVHRIILAFPAWLAISIVGSCASVMALGVSIERFLLSTKTEESEHRLKALTEENSDLRAQKEAAFISNESLIKQIGRLAMGQEETQWSPEALELAAAWPRVSLPIPLNTEVHGRYLANKGVALDRVGYISFKHAPGLEAQRAKIERMVNEQSGNEWEGSGGYYNIDAKDIRLEMEKLLGAIRRRAEELGLHLP